MVSIYLQHLPIQSTNPYAFIYFLTLSIKNVLQCKASKQKFRKKLNNTHSQTFEQVLR